MTISMILGAGFSKLADLPLVRDISDKFLQRPLEKQVLFHGSGEWTWVEWANQADLVNGILRPERPRICLLISNLVDEYLSRHQADVLNYEEFFQFVTDMHRNERLEYETHLKNVDGYFNQTYNIDEPGLAVIPVSEIFSCIYHLVEDLLWLRKDYDQIKLDYFAYIDLFKRNKEKLNIFTLNHDLLLEKVFEEENIKYSDGFSELDSPIMGNDDNRLPVFKNVFDENISLIKLHGSIDYYKYQYIKPDNNHLGYDYFRTLDYYDKQTARHVIDGKIIQEFTPRITPRFITGTNKADIIQEEDMYRELYRRFEDDLPSSDRVIIVGYSYSDTHVNNVIKKAMDQEVRIININPYDKLPWFYDNVEEVNPSLAELDLTES